MMKTHKKMKTVGNLNLNKIYFSIFFMKSFAENAKKPSLLADLGFELNNLKTHPDFLTSQFQQK